MFFRDKSSREISERAVQLAAQLEQVRGAIRTSETMAAEAVAQGVDADFAAVGTLKVKAAAMESAGAILQTEKVAAEKRERLAVAAVKRSEAARLRTEASDLSAKTLKALAKISELQGVEFDESILLGQRTGQWMRNLTTDPRIPDNWRGPNEMLPDLGCRFATPRSRTLLDQAIELEDAADQIDKAEPSAEPEPAGRG